MKASDFKWEESSLTDEDERLIWAYAKVGRPIDDLAYTDDFESLLDKAGFPQSQEERHKRFKQLLNLRKRGRLPRLPPGSLTR